MDSRKQPPSDRTHCSAAVVAKLFSITDCPIPTHLSDATGGNYVICGSDGNCASCAIGAAQSNAR